MTTFHFHFPTPPERTHFDAHLIADEHPGAAALREYWQAHHSDAPAVKPTVDVVANERRARNLFTGYWHRVESFDDALRVFGIETERAPF